MKTAPITILLVDDHALLRETLAKLLQGEHDLTVVGSADNAGDALPLVAALKPAVVLLDIDMPGQSCFDAARRMISSSPRTSIVYLSGFFHDRYIENALAAHASGYVTKDEQPAVILAAIRSAARGAAYFSPRVQARLVVDTTGVALARAGQSRASLLTQRELEVLSYLARGLSKKEISGPMGLSVKTVNRHTENLMQKLDIHDRVELARFAIREGLAEA